MIAMRSVKSSLIGVSSATKRRAFMIFVCAQVLGLYAVCAQELPQPRIEEEISKQEKIYRSRGDEVPRGYVIDRGLSGYAELLPAGFCDALGKLRSSDQWLDIGAGSGQAILDYYAPRDDDGAGKKCAGAGEKARALAISIEDRRTDTWQQQATSLGASRIRYLSGKRLRDYSSEELGKFRIITDVFGGFSYSERLYLFVDKVLSLLEIGGTFYTLVPGVHLENAKDKLGILYLTELEDATGRPERMCSWLKKSACTQVTCESKSDWKRPTELIKIEKVCSDTSVAPMKLLEFEAGYPPSRRFQIE